MIFYLVRVYETTHTILNTENIVVDSVYLINTSCSAEYKLSIVGAAKVTGHDG